MKFPKLSVVLIATTFLSLSVGASEGHDHGESAPQSAAEALPRFSAVSESFELVGVLSGKQITLYLDRFADNSTVRNAEIELDIGGTTFKAGKQGEDEYEVVLPTEPKPGVLTVSATVVAGAESDLLAGELDVHEEAHTDEAVTRSTLEYVGWFAGGLAGLALFVWAGRRLMTSSSARAGGAA